MKWKIWTGLIALFLSGLIIGAAGMQMYMFHEISRASEARRPFVRVLLLKKLTRGLELTPEQRQKLAEIVDKTAEQLIDLRRKQIPAVDAVLEQAIAEMKRYLSPDQQILLEKRFAKFKLKRDRSLEDKQGLLKGRPRQQFDPAEQ